MTREITSHKLNECNNQLEITVVDSPGSGGAFHRYDITGFDSAGNPSSIDAMGYIARFSRTIILFQNGPIPESGVNGITQEALLAIVIDRLECFQSGPFACPENAAALDCVRSGLNILHQRTQDRLNRGVEGTHEQ